MSRVCCRPKTKNVWLLKRRLLNVDSRQWIYGLADDHWNRWHVCVCVYYNCFITSFPFKRKKKLNETLGQMCWASHCIYNSAPKNACKKPLKCVTYAFAFLFSRLCFRFLYILIVLKKSNEEETRIKTHILHWTFQNLVNTCMRQFRRFDQRQQKCVHLFFHKKQSLEPFGLEF